VRDLSRPDVQDFNRIDCQSSFVKETCCICEDLCSTTAVVINMCYASSFHKNFFSKRFGVFLFIFVSQLDRISTEFSLVFVTSVDQAVDVAVRFIAWFFQLYVFFDLIAIISLNQLVEKKQLLPPHWIFPFLIIDSMFCNQKCIRLK